MLQGCFWYDVLRKNLQLLLRFLVAFWIPESCVVSCSAPSVPILVVTHPCRPQPMVRWCVQPSAIEGSTQWWLEWTHSLHPCLARPLPKPMPWTLRCLVRPWTMIKLILLVKEITTKLWQAQVQLPVLVRQLIHMPVWSLRSCHHRRRKMWMCVSPQTCSSAGGLPTSNNVIGTALQSALSCAARAWSRRQRHSSVCLGYAAFCGCSPGCFRRWKSRTWEPQHHCSKLTVVFWNLLD